MTPFFSVLLLALIIFNCLILFQPKPFWGLRILRAFSEEIEIEECMTIRNMQC